MTLEELYNEPSLAGIDHKKLELLFQLTNQAGDQKKDDLLPFLLSSLNGNESVDFNDSETELILQILKTKMSPKDIKRIDTIRNLSKILTAKNKSAVKK